MANYDAAAIVRLNQLYAAPQIVEQRRCFREILRARPGEKGLDVGCGAGHLSCELAREVGPGGRIYGIDTSPDSVTATKLRAEGDGLASGERSRGDPVRAGPRSVRSGQSGAGPCGSQPASRAQRPRASGARLFHLGQAGSDIAVLAALGRLSPAQRSRLPSSGRRLGRGHQRCRSSRGRLPETRASATDRPDP